jgi:SAM domain (Sterile alpha motif)
MATNDKDPRSWEIEEVRRWAESTFPFGESLAQSLVANDVDGAVLLAHITDDTLKVDVGIKSLGQRAKILEKVAELRISSGIIPLLLQS